MKPPPQRPTNVNRSDPREEAVWNDSTMGLEPSAFVNRLALAMEELPREYRAVIMLRQSDRNFEEIGMQLGRTEAETRQLWGRAILELGRRMSGDA